ncbi:hypothetical protein H4R35_006725, partial [Dimargaris xerosporica]
HTVYEIDHDVPISANVWRSQATSKIEFNGILYDIATVSKLKFPRQGSGVLYYVTNGSRTVELLRGYLEAAFIFSDEGTGIVETLGPKHQIDTIALPRAIGTELLNLLNAASTKFAVTPNGVNATMIDAIHSAILKANPSGQLIPRVALSVREQPKSDREKSQAAMSAETIVGVVFAILALLCIVSAIGFCICRTHRFAQARKRRQQRRLERQRQEQLLLEGGVPVAPEVRDMRRDRAIQTFFTAMTKPETPPIQHNQLNKVKTFLITKKRMKAIRTFWRENQCDQTCALHSQMGSLSTIVTSKGLVALSGIPLSPTPSIPLAPAPLAIIRTMDAATRPKGSVQDLGLRVSFVGLNDTPAKRSSAPLRHKFRLRRNQLSPLQTALVNEKVADFSHGSTDAKTDDLGGPHMSIRVASAQDPSLKCIAPHFTDQPPKLNSALCLSSEKSTQGSGHSGGTTVTTLGTAGTTTIGTIASDAASCSICLCNFQLGDEARKLPCRHVFHKECIDVWLLEHSALCPICREHCLSMQG